MDPIELLIEKKTSAGNDVVASFRGRPRNDLRLKEPKEIFRSLGIRGPSGKQDAMEAITDLFVKARNEPAFAAAFGSPMATSDQSGKKGLFVPIGNIDIKSMAQYLALWLVVAFECGYITDVKDIRVQHETGNRGVIIYPSPRGRMSWKGRSVQVKPEQPKEDE